jgi:hypothetical protein
MAWASAPEEVAPRLPKFRRVWQDSAAALPADAAQTTWTRLSRKEFEQTVQAAERKVQASLRPPWLTTARYEAELEQNQLSGTAVWEIHNPHPFAGLLSLDAFNLALREPPRWEGKGPALFGSHADRPFLLLCEQPGTSRLTFRWTARAEMRPDGLWCRLQLPSAALAVLEISLPAALRLDWPAARSSVLLLGPDAKQAGIRRWQVSCGGKARPDLTLVIRPETDPEKTGLVEVQQRSDYQVDLSGVQARFLLDWEASSGRLGPLCCTVDPSLEVQEVLLIQAEPRPLPWHWEKPVTPPQLVISLPEDADRKVTLEIKATVRQPSGKPLPWQLLCPTLHPLGTAPPKEIVRLRTATALALSNWNFGGFQPTGPPRTERSGGETYEILSLEPQGAPSAQRPSALISLRQAEGKVHQETWWHVSPDASRLLVKSIWQAEEGKLHTLYYRLPEGWLLEEVSLTPLDMFQGWSWPAGTATQPLQVELREPLTPGNAATLLLRLRPAKPLFTLQQPATLPIPYVEPLGIRSVEQSLAITLHKGRTKDGPVSLFGAEVRNLAARRTRPPRGENLWSGQAAVPDFYFQTHQPRPGGILHIAPLPTQREAQVLIELSQEGNRRLISYELQIQPGAGAVANLPLRFTTEPPPLTWRLTGGGTATWQAKAGGGQLQFAKPLQEPTTVRATVTIPLEAEIPLPLPEATLWNGQLLVRPAPGETLFVEGTGLTKLPLAAPLPASFLLGEAYRYGPTSHGVRLRGPHSGPTKIKAEITAVRLHLRLHQDGWLEGQYEADFQRTGSEPLRLQLPADAALQEVAVDGLPLGTVSWEQGLLTLAPGSLSERLRVVFRCPEQTSWWGGWLTTPQITWREEVPIRATECHWLLPAEVRPLRDLHHTGSQGQWRVWYFSATTTPARVLWLRSSLLLFLGIVLGIVCGGWMLRRTTTSRRNPLLVGLGLCLAAWLLPEGVKILTAFPLVALGLGFALRSSLRPGTTKKVVGSATIAGILLLVGWYEISWGGTSEEPTALVYILPGPEEKPQDQAVLVPTKLWEQLRQLAQQTCADLPPYFLLHAEYRGTPGSGALQWQGEITLHVFREGPVEIPLKLGTGRLRQLTLDGAPVAAIPLPRGDGVRLRTATTGRHTLRMAWDTPLREQGALRETRCQTPLVAVSRAVVTLPLPARGLRLEGTAGGVRQEANEQALQMQTELGDSQNWNLRWHADQEENSAVRVEEAYFWDIRPAAITQRVWLHYEVQRGAVQEVSLVLPPQGQLRSVELLSPPGQEAPPRLQQWRILPVENVGRVLVLTLADLERGPFRVHLELLQPVPPEGAEGQSATLRLVPAQPLNVERRQGWGAYSIEGWQATWNGDAAQQIVEVDPSSWLRLSPVEAGPRVQPQRVFRWSTWPPTKEISLTLAPATLTESISTHLTLGLASGEVRVLATAEIRFGRQPRTFLRCQLPPQLTLTEVSGSAVTDWMQEGNLVLLWLRPGLLAATTIKLIGWQPTQLAQGQETVAVPQLVFDLPSQSARLTLERQGPITAKWLRSPAGLQVLPTVLPERPPWGTYLLSTTPSEGILLLEAEPSSRRLQASITLTPTQEHLLWEVRLRAPEERGLSRLRIVLDDWPGGPLRLPGREGVAQQVRRRADGKWEWTIQGTESLLPLTLTARLPWRPDRTAVLPHLDLPDLRQVQRRLKLPTDLQWVGPIAAPQPDSEGWGELPAGPGAKVKWKE